MDRNHRSRRLQDAVWAKLGDGAVVLDMHTGQHLELDAVGFFIWKFLDGKSSLGKIAREMAKRFRVTERTAFTDLGKFLSTLQSLGLTSVY